MQTAKDRAILIAIYSASALFVIGLISWLYSALPSITFAGVQEFFIYVLIGCGILCALISDSFYGFCLDVAHIYKNSFVHSYLCRVLFYVGQRLMRVGFKFMQIGVGSSELHTRAENAVRGVPDTNPTVRSQNKRGLYTYMYLKESEEQADAIREEVPSEDIPTCG